MKTLAKAALWCAVPALVFAQELPKSSPQPGSAIKIQGSTQTARYAAKQKAKARRANLLFGLEDSLPQLVVGGEWTAILKVTNLGPESLTTAEAFFTDDSGNPLPLRGGGDVDFEGSSYAFSLIGFAVLEIQLEALDDATHLGWIFLENPDECLSGDVNCRLYAEITLKNSHPSRPDFESVFPMDSPSSYQMLLFDHRDGYSTYLYVVNWDTAPAFPEIQIYDDFGELIATIEDITLPPEGSTLINLHVEVPETLGHYGAIVVTSPDGEDLFLVTALRLNPTNSFTPVRGFEAITF